MRTHIASALIVFALLAVPLSADLSGITTKPLSFPSFASEMTIGPDGNIWMLTDKGNLGKLTSAGTYTEFPMPWGTQNLGGMAIPNAQNLTSGIDGNLWLIGLNGHIGRVTPAGVFTDFAVSPSFYYNPVMVSGADGALWFFNRPSPGPGASNAWKLGRIDIYGQVTTFDIGISNDQLRGLVSGGDGNLWFIDENKSQVVKFSIATKSVAGTFAIPSASNQDGDDQMVLAPDGNVWFTRGTSIDRIKTDGTITEFHVPSGGHPTGIVTGGDGNIWFTEHTAGKIGQLVVSSITPGGSATINETGAIVPYGEELFALPPGFANGSGKTGAQDVKPCPELTYLVRLSPPNSTSGNATVVSTAPVTACADIGTITSIKSVLANGVTYYAVEINVFNGGPNDAVNVSAICNLTAIPGTTILDVVVDDGSVIKASSGLTVTLTKSSLADGADFSAAVTLRNPPGLASNNIIGSTIAFSDLPDPKPKNNVSSDSTGSSVLGRTAIQPDLSDIVITPILRGK